MDEFIKLGYFGFTKDMIDTLLTKKKQYSVVAGFIQKNTDESLTLRTTFSRWRKIQLIAVNLY
jgi:hypothetical protein